MTILNNKNTVGSKLSLECNVTTVSGVSSTAEIVWIKNGTMVEETSDGRISIKNDSIRISILQFLYLSEDDESDYTCNATIRDTSNSNSIKLNNFDSRLLHLLYVCVLVPVAIIVCYCISLVTKHTYIHSLLRYVCSQSVSYVVFIL